MNDLANAALAARAQRLTTTAAETTAFALAHPALLSQSADTVSREFRRHARRTDRLREAAERPPAVAVFGASQAGKSYLVSRLTISPGTSLQIDFEGRALDFLLDINPRGGEESTGLVTRFTVHRVATPPGTPVVLRLLSQTDVIRILTNTFVKDFHPEEIVLPTQERLDALFRQLGARAGTTAGDGLTEEDLDELKEYCERHFRANALIEALRQNGFWQRAQELAPRLRAADRAILFAPLWGEVAAFTDLFARLSQALAALGFANRAFAAVAALTPRDEGIVNVRTLLKLGKDTTEKVTVVGAGGARAEIPRAELAALVAELTLTIPSASWPFLQRADLLDFPGARSREEIVDVDRFLATPGKLGFAFLRGKVDYLFQRYNEEQDIAAMVLCVGPSTQEVQTLPLMINNWIEQTLGDIPEKRAQQRNGLFVVLTKFDLEFEQKSGEASSAGRWDTRVQTNLLDFLGKSYDWPTNWTPGQPFSNLFWLRSTAVRFDTVFDYQGSGTGAVEDRIAPRGASLVAERRRDYLESPLVRRHFADPEAAWDAGLAPKDGGISRLAAALETVCDPAVKGAQINARLNEVTGQMLARLRPFWRSDDREAERRRARAEVEAIVGALRETIRAQGFGPLLRAMQLSPAEVRGLIWQIESSATPDQAPIGTTADSDGIDKLLDELFPTSGTTQSAATRDYFDAAADALIAAWDDALQSLAGDADHLARYRLTPETAGPLVGVISAAARRLGQQQRLARALRDSASFLSRAPARSDRMALVAEDEVNSFVTWLGFQWCPPQQRKLDNGTQVFQPRATLRGLPPLGARPTPYDQNFTVDWVRALLQVAQDNASDESGVGFDRPANDALGALIRSIEAA
ncbi:MAG TPA: virulence factor SrfC family protein [Acetobacteraceae bacterium]|nr:virulence factor SrfC family protein [Acetobacteraceae bacterium]